MKTLHYAKILLAALLCLLIGSQTMAQRGTGNTREELNKVYFWFNVKLVKAISRESRMDIYNLRLVSPQVLHGNLKEYQRALWAGTAQGTKIAVGPFETFKEASNAVSLYKMVNDTVTPREQYDNLHWFLIKVDVMERSRSYQFERMAARVASGSSAEFSDVLRESLAFKTLAIGPFSDEMEAEKSKMLYRIEE
ncbi:MAG: hypothetical protein MJZ61_03280 [Bacteroidales bacterium]|nr:hypothetical protein [Bacteroidales bacterium]